MSLRLHETTIACGKCGGAMWRITQFTYNLDRHINEETEGDPVCRKCEPQRYYGALKNATRIEPLIATDETQKTRGGIITRMDEAPLDGKIQDDGLKASWEDDDDGI